MSHCKNGKVDPGEAVDEDGAPVVGFDRHGEPVSVSGKEAGGILDVAEALSEHQHVRSATPVPVD